MGMMIICLILFGLVSGSFLNVVIYRVPRGESLVLPPSHCPNCQHRLGLIDLVPVFSYLLLRGRCHYCRAPISGRYPLVELLTAALTVLCWYRFGPTTAGLAALILTYGLIAIAFIDLDLRIIPDKITLPLLAVGLLFRGLQGEILWALLDVLIAGGIPFIIAVVFEKILQKEALGGGDVKYLAMIGAFLGWYKALYSLFAGSFFGLLVIGPLMLLKKIGRHDYFPFGPFLVVGALVLLYFSDYLPKLIMP